MHILNILLISNLLKFWFKKLKTKGNYWLGYFFEDNDNLLELFNELEKIMNEDYIQNVK